jgi:hypothetical protein
MFCPVCGSEQLSQYCRSCGMDLRRLHSVLEKQDETKTPYISAREEIGRAFADKIREMKSAKELTKVVEEVLPGIEDFLKTPEEKRLNRIRAGMITAAVGLGAALAFFTLGWFNIEEGREGRDGSIFIACLGLTTFLIGLGIMLNGWFFTIPKKLDKDHMSETFGKTAAESLLQLDPKRSKAEGLFTSSVSEHTTHQLSDSEAHVREGN